MLLGRGVEQNAITRLLDHSRQSVSGCLVLEGGPGIGKTALLNAAHDLAGDMTVLKARGVESESDLPFAGLHQLLRPAFPLLERLPGPQAAALSSALGLKHGQGGDRLLIASACLTLLSELAEAEPVVCLVDDVHWLDSPSIDALLFVARRIFAERIALVLAVREDHAPSLQARDLPTVTVDPLDHTAAGALLAQRSERPIAPSVADVLVQQAAGNALALVELPSALTDDQLLGHQPLPDPLPLTRGLARLLLDQVTRLPEPSQTAVLVVAAAGTSDLAAVLGAIELLGEDAGALDAAEVAGTVSITGPHVDVRHPLLRTAVYQNATTAQRRLVHLALAEVLDSEREADQCAWHRASAAPAPDAAIADQLAATAERARIRGGYGAAASALRRAADLSPDPTVRSQRLIAAATAAWHGGRPDDAAALLDTVEPMATDAALRADVAFVRGKILFQGGPLLAACDSLLAGASFIAASDPVKALRMLTDAANAAENAGDYARLDQALRSVSTAPTVGGGNDVAGLLLDVGQLLSGTAQEVPHLRAAVDDPTQLDDPIWLLWAAFGAGVLGNRSQEGALLQRGLQVARASGAVDLIARALLVVSVNGLFAGRYSVIAEANEGLSLCRQARLSNTGSAFSAILAWIAAVTGHADEARPLAAAAIEHASSTGMALAHSIAQWALAMLDLSSGRPDDAVDRLLASRTGEVGITHPYIALISTADLVEGCTRTGKTEAATTAVAMLSEVAAAAALPWAQALTLHCNALLAPADQAEQHFLDALRLHEHRDRPYDRARTELAFGQRLRRDRRRKEAREHLRGAIESFERLGATPWATLARSEHRASGETSRPRRVPTFESLTPQELQVVNFVSQGLTNKEVAAQLFLSPRTVDHHLRNVFSKLGVTSRTHLARLTSDGRTLEGPASQRPGGKESKHHEGKTSERRTHGG